MVACGQAGQIHPGVTQAVDGSEPLSERGFRPIAKTLLWAGAAIGLESDGSLCFKLVSRPGIPGELEVSEIREVLLDAVPNRGLRCPILDTLPTKGLCDGECCDDG